MRNEHERVILGGKTYELDLLYVEETDREFMRNLFKSWIELSKGMKQLHARGINIPEGISEGIYALEYQCPRVIGGGSFDAVDLKNHKKLQIKACSVGSDLTSFSPKSTWDNLCFMDFYGETGLDGSIDVYRLSEEFNEIIFNLPIGKEGETFRQQQNQGRRPRFSIKKEIIEEYNLEPDDVITL